MALLAQTLALLAMALTTTVVCGIPLDMAPDSFDDQYQGCSPAMKAALPALNYSEFHQNREFAEAWVKAAAEWQSRGPRVSPLSPDQATAIMAFTKARTFNDAVRVAGRSHQIYQDNFHFKTLHFLLTQALATLRDAQKGQCRDAFLKMCDTRFEAQRGDNVRFGLFMPVFPSKPMGECSRMDDTMLEVHTCHGVEVQIFTENPEVKVVLIPPFETFTVTKYTREWDKTQIQLRSAGTFSKYNCEWLGGGSVPRSSFHLGGLLLSTTALAVATGII